VNFKHRQVIIFKDKILLLKAYIKSRSYEVDFAINKASVISLLAIASDSELYT
jgi:hypothetical protein